MERHIMQIARIPNNETARLEVLSRLNIIDSPREDRFDRYTRLATRLFNVPFALISLVDENRQWFKSAQGIPVLETPRAHSVCAHAILQNEVFVIPDTTKDERFKGNPLVTGAPHVRFYAGMPIAPIGGFNLGTVCILDTVPRDFSEEDKNCLRDLAAMASDEMVLFLDELTGLTNRRGFNMIAQPVLSACHRNKGKSTVVMIDLNGFKPINDKYGHQEGDIALKMFSRLMNDVFRESDVVCRIGGDEFCVLLSNSTEKDANASLQRLHESLERENLRNAYNYQLNFSAGVVESSLLKAPIIEEMLRLADKRLYEDKALKRKGKPRTPNPFYVI